MHLSPAGKPNLIEKKCVLGNLIVPTCTKYFVKPGIFFHFLTKDIPFALVINLTRMLLCLI